MTCRYGHLASFVRGAPDEQQFELWKEVGELVQHALSNKAPNKALWLSTDGSGVPWLHVRLDRSPKYIKHEEYRTVPKPRSSSVQRQVAPPRNRIRDKRQGKVDDEGHAQDARGADPQPNHQTVPDSKRLMRKQRKNRRKVEKANARNNRCWASFLRVLKAPAWLPNMH